MIALRRTTPKRLCFNAFDVVDLPFSGGEYFAVRVGRPIWRGARLRRAG